MGLRIIKNEHLIKAVNRANLVLVEVAANTRHGQHRSHRWKNPTAALKDLKNDFQKNGAHPNKDLEFTNKKGEKVSEKEFIKDYEKNGKPKNLTLQQYIKQAYKSVGNGENSKVNEGKPIRVKRPKKVNEETGDGIETEVEAQELPKEEKKEDPEYKRHFNENLPIESLGYYDQDLYKNDNTLREMIKLSYDFEKVENGEGATGLILKNKKAQTAWEMTFKESAMFNEAVKRIEDAADAATNHEERRIAGYKVLSMQRQRDSFRQRAMTQMMENDENNAKYIYKNMIMAYEYTKDELISAGYTDILEKYNVPIIKIGEDELVNPESKGGKKVDTLENFDKAMDSTVTGVYQIMERSGDFERTQAGGDLYFKSEEDVEFWQRFLNAAATANILKEEYLSAVNVSDKKFKEYVDFQKKLDDLLTPINDMKVYGVNDFPYYKEKVVPFMEYVELNAAELSIEYTNKTTEAKKEEDLTKKWKSIRTFKSGMLNHKEIAPRDTLLHAETREQLIDVVARGKDLSQRELALNVIDALKVNIPLRLGTSDRYGGKVVSQYLLYGGKDVLYMHLNTSRKASQNSKISTIVHESMHAMFPDVKAMYTSMNEVAVECSASYALRELGQTYTEGKPTLSYPAYNINLLPILKTIPMLKKCETSSDFGAVFMDKIMKGDKAFFTRLHNKIKPFIESGNGPLKSMEYLKRYIPDDVTERNKILNKHGDTAMQATRNLGDYPEKIEGMATLISALKSGALNLENALASGSQYRGVAFILLTILMDEEGIDPYDLTMEA